MSSTAGISRRGVGSGSPQQGVARAAGGDHHHGFGVVGLRNKKQHQHLHGGNNYNRRRKFAILIAVICAFWFVILWKLYAVAVTNSTTSTSTITEDAASVEDGATKKITPSHNAGGAGAGAGAEEKQQQDGGNGLTITPPRIIDKNDYIVVDGTFNTLPLKLVSNNDGSNKPKLRSFVECVRHNQQHTGGDNNKDNAWMYTSCQFTNLCMDTNTHEYVVVADDSYADELHELQQNQGLAIGGINPRWDMSNGFNMGSYKVKWFPEIRKSSQIKSYYQLPNDVIWIPFHSMGGHNVGHMLWDDFYPIYRLAEIFGYTTDTDDTDTSSNNNNNKYRWFLTRYVVNGTLYASCDIRRNKRIQCTNNFAKFLDLLGSDPFTFTSNRRIRFEVTNSNKESSVANLVCARTGLAGIGMLTDHGLRDHGWELKQSWIPHNYMHGHTFYNFRKFILNNIKSQYKLRIPTAAASLDSDDTRLRITFSILSSRDYDRRLDFNKQIHALQQALSDDSKEVIIGSHALWNMTVPEQLQLALDTHIWVQACGGASMTSTFLNRGSSLILFYNETGGLNFKGMQLENNGMPARLDWDLLDNSHLRLHWFAIGTMNTQSQLEVFVKLIKHELLLIRNTIR